MSSGQLVRIRAAPRPYQRVLSKDTPECRGEEEVSEGSGDCPGEEGGCLEEEDGVGDKMSLSVGGHLGDSVEATPAPPAGLPAAPGAARGEAAPWRRRRRGNWRAHAQPGSRARCGARPGAPGARTLMVPLVAGREAH